MAVNRKTLAGMVALAALLSPTLACGQDLGVYVGGALSTGAWKPHHTDGGSASLTFNNYSTDATVGSVTAEAGGFFSRFGGVGVAATVPLGRRNVTSTRYYVFGPGQTVSRYEERSLFVVARVRMPATRRIGVGIAGGVGSVFEGAIYRSAALKQQSGTYVPGPFSAEQAAYHLSPAVSIGGDVTIRVSRHLQVVPELRVLLIGRSAPIDQNVIGDFGLPGVMFRLGIGLRATF